MLFLYIHVLVSKISGVFIAYVMYFFPQSSVFLARLYEVQGELL